MTRMAIQQPDQPETLNRWRWALALIGAVALLAALAFEIISLVLPQVTTVTVTGTHLNPITTTSTGPGGPPSGLIAGLFGGGAVIILAAAFFTRITKIILPGGAELDLDSQAQLAGAVAQDETDPQQAAKVYKAAAPKAVAKVAEKKYSAAAQSAISYGPNPDALNPQEAAQLVDEARQEVESSPAEPAAGNGAAHATGGQ